MALQKEVTLHNGAVATYLKLGFVKIEFEKDRVSIFVEEYATLEARFEGKQPMNTHFIETRFSEVSSVSGDLLMNQLYNKIKEDERYAGSINV